MVEWLLKIECSIFGVEKPCEIQHIHWHMKDTIDATKASMN